MERESVWAIWQATFYSCKLAHEGIEEPNDLQQIWIYLKDDTFPVLVFKRLEFPITFVLQRWQTEYRDNRSENSLE